VRLSAALFTLAIACNDGSEPSAPAQRASAEAQASSAPRPDVTASSEPTAALRGGAPERASAAPEEGDARGVETPDPACVDLTAGKVPPRGDADAATKYRPPARLQGRARGFDTSTPAPFKSLREAGFDFGFVQAGIGLKKNDDFEKNWAAARACKIPRGAYQFISATDGAAQGRVMVDALGGDIGELPPTLDLEKPPKCEDECCGDPCGVWTARVDAWLETVERATRRPSMIYMVEPFFAQCLCATPKYKDRALWLAAWPRFDFPEKPRLGGFGAWTFYQYEGNVRRYGGVIDLNLFSGDEAAFKEWLARQSR
jgi:lysozyme